MSQDPKAPVANWETSLKQLSKQSAHILGLRFPSFRNFEPDAQIHFRFPITVLLGRNGTNKSSLLHALCGTPEGSSTSLFWFETNLDGIPREDERGLKPSVVHWHQDSKGNTIYSIKARAPRGTKDPDYWETVKPTAVYGFQPNAPRGKPINLPVLHLDFRGLLPAFDKYFYFPDFKHLRARAAEAKARGTLRRDYRINDYLRVRTRGLRAKIDKEGTRLSAKELAVLSYVLEREYVGGTLLQHDRFKHPGVTILFETKRFGKSYSEAFAGSGESAAAMLIHKIEGAKVGSLILLDEP